MRDNDFFGEMPFFFKLWFAICILLGIAMLGTVGYVLFTVITDPGSIGSFFGEIAKGFRESSQ